ncbi:hypothetical protein Vadar_034092 [Vaccinium darrowii]|uniref:Uncharacterized protein n=1 Tax=Vaccinium darrowii TaxID=229202 RepID=A0ACB7YS36_9ERIC|nr:hypothetical protein Vadar_034092 [Vaccinium darrowii]
MENQTQKKAYLHYEHTDACKYSRWTARESYEFMYARPWQQVLDFYSNIVNGHMSFSTLFGAEMRSSCDGGDVESESTSAPIEDRTGRWARVTFKIILSYHGGSFDGWQKQPGLNTVQGLVETSLGRFVDDMKAQQLKDKGSPIEGTSVVAGRTDKGVTALQQVCSFYTWRKDIKPQDIVVAINEAAPGKLRVVSVAEMSRGRRMLSIQIPKNIMATKYDFSKHIGKEIIEDFDKDDVDGLECQKKPRRFKISKVNQLLLQLEGKSLSYKVFARDTKASRNIGPPTECFLFHARASEIRLPCSGSEGGYTKAMCVELVANRFLRRMVRVLVSTAIREAAAGAEDDALLKLVDATCRRATAPPAPPDGLCLVDVGYTEFDPQICLIS